MTFGPQAKMQMLKCLMLLAVLAVLLLAGCSAVRRKLLFYPTHHDSSGGFATWEVGGAKIGYCRPVNSPKNIWLMLHGNGGQAADRAYALPCFSTNDSVFVMEYPGYGRRKGAPSKGSFDAAAVEAYISLSHAFPETPICVVGESIGSGPACMLANQSPPPDKIVLVVPFDTLKSVASEHFPILPVGLILGASWDNIRSLRSYKGPVEVFGAMQDTIIPVAHAKKLAESVPSAVFHTIEGGHNEWSQAGRVQIRR
jgi:pimeloyl-ACP methyl ester carboxylesterase